MAPCYLTFRRIFSYMAGSQLVINYYNRDYMLLILAFVALEYNTSQLLRCTRSIVTHFERNFVEKPSKAIRQPGPNRIRSKFKLALSDSLFCYVSTMYQLISLVELMCRLLILKIFSDGVSNAKVTHSMR